MLPHPLLSPGGLVHLLRMKVEEPNILESEAPGGGGGVTCRPLRVIPSGPVTIGVNWAPLTAGSKMVVTLNICF